MRSLGHHISSLTASTGTWEAQHLASLTSHPSGSLADLPVIPFLYPPHRSYPFHSPFSSTRADLLGCGHLNPSVSSSSVPINVTTSDPSSCLRSRITLTTRRGSISSTSIALQSVVDRLWLTHDLTGTPLALRRRKSVESPSNNDPSLAGDKIANPASTGARHCYCHP